MASLGSCISVRSATKFGSKMSSFDTLDIGSSISLRTFIRFGSNCSIIGGTCTSHSNPNVMKL
jgi:hypothetical protein